jgi:hypothetical protein
VATYGSSINNEGVVVGYFYNTTMPSSPYWQGFFYQNGTWKNYSLPGLPPLSTTQIFGINNLGDFCGRYQEAPSYAPTYAYLSHNGHIESFQFNGLHTEATAVNDSDYVAGIYLDSSSVWHGFVRDPEGNMTSVDVTGVTNAPGLGTILFDINNSGWISGHFGDAKLNEEHGFLGIPEGNSYSFYVIDVPGATATAGAGLNNFGQVPGHWIDAEGDQLGYVATLLPPPNF